MRFLPAFGSFLVLAVALAACHGDAATSALGASTTCATAGGTCTPYSCAKEAPSAAQDCYGMDKPTCCLELAIPVGPDGGELVTPEGGVTCADRTSTADQAMAAAVAMAREDMTCATDADCLTVPTATLCSAGCSLVVNKAGASQISNAVAAVNGVECFGSQSEGCKVPSISCPVLDFPTCVNGACTNVPPDCGVGTTVVCPGSNCRAAGGACNIPSSSCVAVPNEENDCAMTPGGLTACCRVLGDAG